MSSSTENVKYFELVVDKLKRNIDWFSFIPLIFFYDMCTYVDSVLIFMNLKSYLKIIMKKERDFMLKFFGVELY